MNLDHPINAATSDDDRTPLVSDNDYHSRDWPYGDVDENVRNDGEAKLASQGCFQSHKKGWKIAVLVVGIFLILMVSASLIVTFGVAPGLIRKVVEEAHLEIGELSLTNPEMNEVSISLKGWLDRSSPIPATLLSSRYTVNYGGNEVGYFELPDIMLKGKDGKTLISSSSTLSIQSLSAFSSFSKAMIDLEVVEWQLKGEAYVKVPLLFGIEVKVKLSKSISMSGLNGFKSLQLSNVSFIKSTREHVIMDANVEIMNPSVISINPIGQLSLAIFYQDSFMGIAHTENARIIGGGVVNVIKASAFVTPHNLNKASSLISDFLSSRVVNVVVSSRYSLSNDAEQDQENDFNDLDQSSSSSSSSSSLAQDLDSSSSLSSTPVNQPFNVSSIPLYNLALQNLTVETSFVQWPPLQLIPDIDVSSMHLIPISNETCGLKVRMRATINNPLGPNCPLIVHSINVNTSLLFHGLATGHFDAPTQIISQNATSMEVNASTIFFIDKNTLWPSGNGDVNEGGIDGSIGMEESRQQSSSSIALRSRGILSSAFLSSPKSAFSELLERLEKDSIVSVAFSGTTDINATVEALGFLSLKDMLVNVTTDVKGLDGLKGAVLTEVEVPGNAPGGYGSGLSIFANGTLFNPSAISMFLGDVDMVMYANNTFMGRVTCDDFSLNPGNNFISVHGIMNPSNLTAAAVFFREYLTGIDSRILIQGSTGEGEEGGKEEESSDTSSGSISNVRFDIDWLNEAIRTLTVDALVPAKKGYHAILGMDVLDLALDFTTKDPMVPLANGTMKAYYDPPFGFDFNFLNASIAMSMTFQDIDIAHMFMPWHGLTTNKEDHSFVVSVESIEVKVSDSHQFSLFLLELFLTVNTTCGLHGLAAANVDCHMGVVPMTGIPFNNSLFVNGTNRFQTPPVTVDNLNLEGGEAGFAFISLDVNITNPSSASLVIGDLVLNLVFNDTYVGNGTIKDMKFYKGLNSYKVAGIFVQTEENEEASRLFLSQFIQGHPLPVQLQGSLQSTPIPLLQLAMSNLVAPAVLPGFSQKLISYAQLIFDLSALLQGKIPAKLTVFNPFDANIAITHVHVNVVYKDSIIALIDKDFTLNPIIAYNHTYSVTPVIQGTIEGVSIDFFRTLTGTILVTVNGTMDVLVGSGFTSTLDYVQHNVSAGFKDPPSEHPQAQQQILLEEDWNF
jgi:hypothetical protein